MSFSSRRSRGSRIGSSHYVKKDAVRDITQCLTEAGFDLELLVADSERRLLDSGPEGIRILHSEPIFKSTAFPL